MRLIDADTLRYEISKLKYPEARINMILAECVNKAPEVDAVPVVRGEWVYSRTQSDFAVSKCSACGKEQFSISNVVKYGNYCPNCGAKMEDKP